jgi:hypothetical protein
MNMSDERILTMNNKRLTVISAYAPLILAIFLGFRFYQAAAAAAGPPSSLQADPGAPLACTVDTPGLSAYWPLDSLSGSQIEDVVGTSTGTCTGDACPTAEAGKVNGALAFNGSDQINIPDAPLFNFSNGTSFSIELWVKMTSDCSASRQVFLGKYRDTPSNFTSWWVGCEVTNQAAFNLRDTSGKYLTLNGGPVLNNGQWHQVVAVRNAAEGTNLLYVDGALATSQAQLYSADFIASRELNIGYYNVDPFYPFVGSLDEIGFYNRALSTEEVARHYNKGAGQSYCNDAPNAVDDVLVAIRNTPLGFPAGALTFNDLDPDGDLITITAIGPSTTPGGSVSGSGPYTYTPPGGYTGPDSFPYTLSDGKGGVDSATVNVTVRLTNGAPTVTKPPDQTNAEGTIITPLQIQASDPDNDPIHYSASNLPLGLSINPNNGQISGTISFAAATGSPYTVQVTVTDAGLLTDTETFTWTVTNVNGAPVVQQPSNQFHAAGETIFVQIQATDPDNDPLTYSATGLPANLTLNPTTGLISGTLGSTADALSPYTVEVTVADNAGHSVKKTFAWIISKFAPPKIYLPVLYKGHTVP